MCHGHGWCDHGHCRLANMRHIQGCRQLFKDVSVTHLNRFADFTRFATILSCRCDDGFSGTDCQPSSPLSSSVLSDFESQDALLATWQEVIGGEVVTPDMGCGVVSSGSSLYFSKVTHLPGKVIFYCCYLVKMFLVCVLSSGRAATANELGPGH